MNKKLPRSSHLTVGSEVLQALFENGKSSLSDQFARWKLWSHWPKVVGPTISQASEPVYFNNGQLLIWVKNSSWMQQMVFLADPIKVKVNSYLKKDFVSNVRFTLDRRSVPQNEAEESERLRKFINQWDSEK